MTDNSTLYAHLTQQCRVEAVNHQSFLIRFVSAKSAILGYICYHLQWKSNDHIPFLAFNGQAISNAVNMLVSPWQCYRGNVTKHGT